jgi:hypothetical protein
MDRISRRNTGGQGRRNKWKGDKQGKEKGLTEEMREKKIRRLATKRGIKEQETCKKAERMHR